MRASRELRADAVRYAQMLHQQGWVANHDGNISAKIASNRFLATPTATSKHDVTDKNLLEVDGDGNRVSGNSRRFSEINLHLLIYRLRDDAKAVVHAHPPNATALACAGRNLIERPFIAEAIVSLGPLVPLVPFASPGQAAADALEPFVSSVDAVLMENHGALAWGQSIEQAYLRLELVEHLAKIAVAAEACGGVKPLPKAAVEPLLAARAKAGLGQAADRAVELFGEKSVIACAPAPHSSVAVRSGSSRRADVGQIIREEVVKILSKDD